MWNSSTSPNVSLAALAVHDLTLTIYQGEFFALLGPSGCGKTTTLRLIGGLETPDSGEIRIGGAVVNDQPPYARRVNIVFQHYALFPHLTVQDNVAFGLRVQGRRLPEAEVTRRVKAVLDLVQLAGLETRRPHQLSGGQQQRVALARALVLQPHVLLLDEPLGALDRQLRKAMQTELRRIQREVGMTFLYVTHDQDEALSMSDRMAVMRQGAIEQLGTPQDIFQTPRTQIRGGVYGGSEYFHGSGAGQDRSTPCTSKRLLVCGWCVSAPRRCRWARHSAWWYVLTWCKSCRTGGRGQETTPFPGE